MLPSPLLPTSNRSPRLWMIGSADRSAHTNVRRLVRLPAAALALLLAIALGTSAITWSRTVDLRDLGYAALDDVRQLDALLVATRDALHRDDAGGLARADSLADQFHRVAGAAERRAPLHDAAVAAGREFRTYYVQARRHRVAERRGLSSEALADITFGALRAQLDAVGAAQRRSIDEAYDSLQQLHVAAGITMGLIVLAAIALLSGLAVEATRTMAKPVEDAARRAQALADGDLDVELRLDAAGAEGALHRALARIAAATRANRTAAEDLAAGEYRIGTHDTLPDDQIGRALARTSAYLDYLSIAAQRVAEGDLTVAVEPRSPQDSLGHAYAMMIQRLVSMVRETLATAQLITATAEEVHRAAAELTLGSGAETGANTVVIEQLASITAAARTSAMRAAELERRSQEAEATVDEGVVAVRESREAVQSIVRQAEAVEQIAHDAGLIALNTGIEVGRAGAHGSGFVAVADEVRGLATQATDAAREIGNLTSRSAASAVRSTTVLGRLAPAVTQSGALVRELAAATHRQATEIAQAHREISATTEVRRRSAGAVAALAASADTLVGQAQRLGAMLAQFGGAAEADDRETRPASRHLSLHRPATELGAGARRLALVN